MDGLSGNTNERAKALRALADRVERIGTDKALELARRLRQRATEHEIGPEAGLREYGNARPTR